LLPAASRQPEREIVLEITRDHQFLPNGQEVARTELTREISRLYKDRADRQLFIRADKDVEFQEVALAMDDARGVDGSVQFGLLAGK
jgi:biopolymer transport protein ExbD